MMDNTHYIASTSEIRWFFPGEIPGSILQWFVQKGLSDHLEFLQPRKDRYLLFKYSVHCGLKIREGNIDIKVWVGNRGSFRNAPVQLWEKWNLTSAEKRKPGGEMVTDDHFWVEVEKRRSLHFFEPGISPKPLAEPDTDKAYAQFELSEVTLNAQRWWSLNLEIAKREDTSSVFLEIAAHLLSDCPVNLNASQAKSYPAWLHDQVG